MSKHFDKFIELCAGKSEEVLRAEYPNVNFLETRHSYGYTIFHSRKYSKEFLNEQLCKSPGMDLFELKVGGLTMFHTQKYDEEIIRDQLEKWGPVNLFELKDSAGNTIFHIQKYSCDLVFEMLEQYPETNLFELKNKEGKTIFHSSPLNKSKDVNTFKITDIIYGKTMYHKYDESMLKDLICRHNQNIFEVVDSCGNTIFHENRYSEEFIKWCIDRERPIDVLSIRNKQGESIFHYYKYSDELMDYCKSE